MLGKLTAPLEKMAPHDFKRKFHAWWEGEDYIPVPEEISDADLGETPRDAAPQTLAEDVLTMAIAQVIWGSGYLQPCTDKYLADMTHSLSLTSDTDLAILGAGLGGSARDLALQSGATICAYENNAATLAEAEKICAQTDAADSIALQSYDPNTVELPEQAYDALVSFERFFAVREKQRLLNQAELSLRPGGYLLITDYVSTNAEVDEGAWDHVLASADGEINLSSVEDYVTMISEAGFGLRVQEDITHDYLNLIQQGATCWTKLLTGLENADSAIQAKIFQAVGKEQALWAQRLEALQSGKLAVYRFLALKPGAAS